MFKILIRGLKDGDYEIEMNGKGETIEFICPEFQSSEINISGNMKVARTNHCQIHACSFLFLNQATVSLIPSSSA